MTPTLCQHNTLRRQCPICERDDEIARLRAERDLLRVALQELVECKDLKKRYGDLCDQDLGGDLESEEPPTPREVEIRAEATRVVAEYARRKPLAWAAARKALEP